MKKHFLTRVIFALILAVLAMGFVGCPTPVPKPEPEYPWKNADKLIFGTFFGKDAAMERPAGICQDKYGNIYIAVAGRNRVDRFKNDLTFAGSYFGFNIPVDVAIDSSGYLLVLEAPEKRIKKISLKDGKWFDSIAVFETSYGMCLDANGNIYVAGYESNRIRKFDRTGTLLMTINGVDSPIDVAVSPSGEIFALSYDGHCVHKYAPDGTPSGQFGSFGAGDGQFFRPTGIAADKYGKLYVADGDNGRIQKFQPDGTYVCQLKNKGGNALFKLPWGIMVNGEGYILVTDQESTPRRAAVIHQE